MNLEAGASVGQVIIAFATLLVSGGIAWGGLMQRVKALEKQVEGLPGISERLRVVETKVESIQEDVTDIKSGVRDVLTEIRSFGDRPSSRRRPS
jgi:hypothetical protein